MFTAQHSAMFLSLAALHALTNSSPHKHHHPTSCFLLSFHNYQNICTVHSKQWWVFILSRFYVSKEDCHLLRNFHPITPCALSSYGFARLEPQFDSLILSG